jgi:beta-lactamase regulating signal transducer with metallopeptidase domain
MSRLAQTLIAFVWQGALVAALLAAANLILRKAATRYAAACAALAALLLLPAATYVRSVPSTVEPAASSPAFPSADPAPDASLVAPLATGLPTLPRIPVSAERTIVLVWLAGVLALSVRLAGGWAAVEGLRREGVAEPDAAWKERAAKLARRLGLPRPIQVLASSRVAVPAAFGALRPVVLLPAAAFSALPVRELEALLAHELAHIRRHDYLVNLLQSVAETLFFYHPAVWWISHRLRVEREDACDDLAVMATGSITIYARALLDLEEIRPAAPLLTVAANGSQLSQRIARLLRRGQAAGRGPRSLPALLGLLTAFGLLLAARVPRAGAAALPPATSPAPATASADAASTSATALAARLSPTASHAPAPSAPARLASRPAPARKDERAATAESAPEVSAAPAPAPEPSAEAAPAPEAPQASPAPPRLTPERLIAFRIHGVTPEFVEEVKAMGFRDVTADQLVAMRIHGVTPAFARAMKAEGFDADLDQLIAFRIHGVSPEFLSDMRALGLTRLSAETATGFRIHGVTPGFVREIHDLGYPSVSAEQLIAMRIHGVTPDYIRAMNRRFNEKLSVSDLVDARIHGVKGDMR